MSFCFQKNLLLWASQKESVSQKNAILSTGHTKTLLFQLFLIGTLTSLVTDKKGWVLVQKITEWFGLGRSLRYHPTPAAGWLPPPDQAAQSPTQAALLLYVMCHRYLHVLLVWHLDVDKEESTCKRTVNVYGICSENNSWPSPQEQISLTAMADNWSCTEAMPLISLRKSNTAKGQKMECHTSLPSLQPT